MKTIEPTTESRQKAAALILQEVRAHFNKVTGSIERIGDGKPYVHLECNHGDKERIGQYALRGFAAVQTYFACSIFRRATVNIYLK